VNPIGGPGEYETTNNFGDDVKTLPIGVRREEKIIRTAGPGEYQHERADLQTKYRHPAADFEKQEGRKEGEVNPNNGPGTHETHYNFGDGVRTQPIGIRREEPIPVTAGPGEYQHERADLQTKYRHPAADF
jgi:hypothetical protein